MRGRSVSSSRAWFRSMNVTPTSLDPAFNRYSKFRRPIRSAARRLCRHRHFADRDQLHPFAIDGDLDLMPHRALRRQCQF